MHDHSEDAKQHIEDQEIEGARADGVSDEDQREWAQSFLDQDQIFANRVMIRGGLVRFDQPEVGPVKFGWVSRSGPALLRLRKKTKNLT